MSTMVLSTISVLSCDGELRTLFSGLGLSLTFLHNSLKGSMSHILEDVLHCLENQLESALDLSRSIQVQQTRAEKTIHDLEQRSPYSNRRHGRKSTVNTMPNKWQSTGQSNLRIPEQERVEGKWLSVQEQATYPQDPAIKDRVPLRSPRARFSQAIAVAHPGSFKESLKEPFLTHDAQVH